MLGRQLAIIEEPSQDLNGLQKFVVPYVRLSCRVRNNCGEVHQEKVFVQRRFSLGLKQLNPDTRFHNCPFVPN